MASPDLPEIDPAHERERQSKMAVELVFQSRFLVRFEEKSDYGCDGTIELKRARKGKLQATNRRASFQLKSSKSSRGLSEGSVTYRIDTKNIRYLSGASPSFYLLFLQPANQLMFRWLDEICEELDRDRPTWKDKDAVDVCFTRRVDDLALDEIAIRIDAHVEQVQQLLDGPGFIRSLRPDRIRDLLRPSGKLVGRQSESRDLLSRIGQNKVIPVIGPPDSGKTEFIAHCLSDVPALEMMTSRLGVALGLLRIDLGSRIGPRVLRALAFALGVHKIDVLSDADWEESTGRDRVRAQILGQLMPARLQQRALVAVLENAQECLTDDLENADLNEFLASESFRNGTAIVVARWGAVPTGRGKRSLEREIRVGALARSEMEMFLRQLEVGESVASAASQQAEQLSEDLMLPGVIRRGADEFMRLSRHLGGEKLSENLLNALIDASEQVVRETLKGIDCGDLRSTDGSPSPKATLLAMAIISEQCIRRDVLELADLPAPPWPLLLDLGWVEVSDSKYRITWRALRGLRAEVLTVITGDPRNEDSELLLKVLGRLLRAIERKTADTSLEDYAHSVEEALAWIRRCAPSAMAFDARLVEAFLPCAVDDLVFPTSLRQSAATLGQSEESAKAKELGIAIAEAVCTARIEANPDLLFKQFRDTVHLAMNARVLIAHHLRALDWAIVIVQRHFHKYGEVLAIREILAPRLLEITGQEYPDAGILKWSASWLLNTAALAIGLGQLDNACVLVEQGRIIISRMARPAAQNGVAEWLWLRARLLQLEGRTAKDADSRVGKFQEAAEVGWQVFSSSGGHPRWLRFFLRSAYWVAENRRMDDERKEIVDQTMRRLTEVCGNQATWTLSVRAQSAAFIRDAAALDMAPQRRLEAALRAVTLLRSQVQDSVELAELGDARPLLVLVRTQAFLGVCQHAMGDSSGGVESQREATRLVAKALKCAPSTSSWALLLRLIDQDQAVTSDMPWHMDSVSGRSIVITPELRAAIKKCRQWLIGIESWGRNEGRLALWCIQREWQSFGSFARWASVTLHEGQEWDRMANDAKRRVLVKLHTSRERQLGALEARTGPLLEIYLARARNAAQLQRLLAVYGDHQCNASAVLRIYEAAAAIWPDEHMLMADKARFYRYVWEYQNAIPEFRRVVSGAPSGKQQRDASIDLIETLLTAATHCETLEFPDGKRMDRQALLQEARALLPNVVGFRGVAGDAAMLRDRIDFELGVLIDWSAIEDLYKRVIGDVDAHLSTLLSNLDELRGNIPDLPEHLSDAVEANFTSPEPLRALGSLYLRRAETRLGTDPVEDARRAYGVFQACGLWERAWLGAQKGTPTTSYQQARAILIGASITRNPNPFPAYHEGKVSLLHLAEAYCQSAESLSVGAFYTATRKCSSDITRLRKELDDYPRA